MIRGDNGGLFKRAVRYLLSLCHNHDMRAGDLLRMQPDIGFAAVLERQAVVLQVVASA